MKEESTLVLFVKYPRTGEVKTRLGKAIGMQQAAVLYRVYAEKSIALGKMLQNEGYSAYLFYDRPADKNEIEKWVGSTFHLMAQNGPTLGDRMRDAFDQTFARGSKRTVIVGTDIPELDEPTLRQAFDALSSHDVVIGPSSDGGFYLIGMKPPTKELFDGIPWSSPEVRAKTIRRARLLKLSFTQLHELHDIDTLEDYQAYLERTNSRT